MAFSTYQKSRAWVVTMQRKNMEKAGWKKEDYENAEWLTSAITNLWLDSGIGSNCGVAVCVSEQGLYHAHVAAYAKNATTLNKVSKIFYDAHVEPQLGGKKELSAYLKKEGKYAEKGEEVLCCTNIEAVQDNKGHRSDLDEIDSLLDKGMTPREIMSMNIHYRQYDKIIRDAYFDKRLADVPLKREVRVIWHTGGSGSGKTYTYIKLTEQHGEENVYMLTDYRNGGFDKYQGQPILFMDEFKGELDFGTLLTYLDGYRIQIHCRYCNIYALWKEVHISSIYTPDEIYQGMVAEINRDRDSYEQLKRRLTEVVYHYKQDNEYLFFSLPASEYTSISDLKQRAFEKKS